MLTFSDQKAFDVIGLGRLCIDLNANDLHTTIENVSTFTKYVGGSPANIAIACAKLGLKTGFVGKVSNDQFGRFIVRSMADWQIDVSQIAVDQTGAVTGLAFTEIKSPEECSILMYRERVADLLLSCDEIDADYIAQSKTLLISGTALSKSPSREAVFRAIEIARKHGVRIIFDLDYRPYSWGSRHETAIYYRLAAEKSDVILGGKDEFAFMLQDDDADDSDIAAEWLQANAHIVVIKHGGKGSVAFTRQGERFQTGVYPVTPVKTFGAGDSFAGAFIHGLIRGWPVPKCLQYGTASASIVVQSHSCSDAMPTLAQIETVIATQTYKPV